MKMKKVIEYRNVWMGLAIIWIVFFHSGIQMPGEILNKVRTIGYGGVDIFLFASGIGCFYSLEKDSDCFRFVKRRILRIIPTYWIFMSFWGIYNWVCNGMSFRVILGNFLCVRNFTGMGEEFNWYISAMWLMYILAPFFKGLVDRVDSVYGNILCVFFLIIVSVCFWEADVYVIMVTRIPIFYMGMCMGKLAWKDTVMRKRDWGILITTMLLGIVLLVHWMDKNASELWIKGYYWYPFILITPGLCVLISGVMEMIKQKMGKGLEGILATVGDYSFEIYLLHVWFFDVLNNYLIKNEIVQDGVRVKAVVVLALVPSCMVLRYMTKIMNKRIEKVNSTL